MYSLFTLQYLLLTTYYLLLTDLVDHCTREKTPLPEMAIEMTAPFPTLFSQFVPSLYWWEIIEMLRRLVLVGFAVVIWPGSLTQLMIGATAAFMHLVGKAPTKYGSPPPPLFTGGNRPYQITQPTSSFRTGGPTEFAAVPLLVRRLPRHGLQCQSGHSAACVYRAEAWGTH